MAPQIVAGAYIAFSSTDLYPLFEICGRALPISAVQDQGWGGLIMWVPAGAVETFGILVAAMTWWRLHAQGRIYHDKRDLADARAQVKTCLLYTSAGSNSLISLIVMALGVSSGLGVLRCNK